MIIDSDCQQAIFDSVDNNKTEAPSVVPSIINMYAEWHSNCCDVYGVSFLGRQHRNIGQRCQDYLLFNDLGDGWHIYVVSDGAGSAKESHRGAKTNCEATSFLIQELIIKSKWKELGFLPSEVEWDRQFYDLCRSIHDLINEKVESLDEDVTPKDFNATLLLLIVTPLGMLIGHIGDGRMGYMDKEGVWKSLIVPHRGEEMNQTVFIMNAWNKTRFPSLKMSGVLVPETRVVFDVPQSVVIMTDGCENFAWNCIQLNPETGKYSDVNTPFVEFLTPLTIKLASASKEDVKQQFIDYVDNGNIACREEDDDRSFMIGIYYTQTSDDTESIYQ